MSARKGTLVCAGVGIRAPGQLTADARHFIERADEVLYLISENVAERALLSLRPDAQSMHGHYQPGKPREQTYREWVERLLAPVRAGKLVCGAFYGHPGLCADAPHDAVEQARAEGYQALLLPAVSSIDCLWADLGIDPTDAGVQMYEATRFLLSGTKPDVTAGLLLLQIGSIGELGYLKEGIRRDGLRLLAERLVRLYGPDHEAVVYLVPTLLGSVRRPPPLKLRALGEADVPYMATLWVPPKALPRTSAAMLRRLGMG